MALALLGVLALVFAGIILLTLFTLFYKEGSFVKNKTVLIAITIFSLILAYISATSFPSNYILQISIAIGVGIAGLIGSLLVLFKKEMFLTGRILIAISLLGNFFLAFIS